VKPPTTKSADGTGKPRFVQLEHEYQHTLEDFDRLAARVGKYESQRDVLKLADQMLSHGHPDTPLVTALLRQNPHRDVVALGTRLEKCFHHLREKLHVEDLDRKQLVRAYRKDGYLLFESAQRSRKLLVLFTTIFNNFYISHLNLQAMLKDLGCHLLILKETTSANYQRGVANFARDFPDIGEQIRATARRLGADRIYISGFSSGGYAALLTSLRLTCHGYLGFAHTTDLSPDSAFSLPWYIGEAAYARLDRRWLVDLRVALQDADPSVPRVYCYGDRSAKDVLYARHLAGLDTIRVLRLRNGTHNTIQYLLAQGRLAGAFSWLVADR
jgi:hypothetical protein